jgi:hypothetical protein
MNTKDRAEKFRVLIQDYVQNNTGIFCGKHWERNSDPWALIKDNVLVELVSDAQLYKGSLSRRYTYRINRKIPYFSPHINMDTFLSIFKKAFGDMAEANGSIYFPANWPGILHPIIPEISIIVKTENDRYYHFVLQIT